VATFVAFTVAPGTTAPFGSVTVPVNVARVVWLSTSGVTHRHTDTAIAPTRAKRLI
jgi:hypothetical protein